MRAGILCRKAARVAPAGLSSRTRHDAVELLQKLAERLKAVLQLEDAEVAEWMQALPHLLDQADQGSNPVEAKLLEDLQKACVDFEHDIYTLDLMNWVSSAGRRPVVRPLPSQRMVRLIAHLRAAQGPSGADACAGRRTPGSGQPSRPRPLRDCEERIRTTFRPVLTTALQDVGLQPTNPLERTAFTKVVDNILDHIIEQGHLTFGDLRDCLSGNQLKLHDLSGPNEFIRGDPLLRLDRRLATLLDGVYRPSEFYLRSMERLTAAQLRHHGGPAAHPVCDDSLRGRVRLAGDSPDACRDSQRVALSPV